MRKFYFLFAWLSSIVAFSQRDTLRLFYAVNEKESEVNFKRLDSLLSNKRNLSGDFRILGYADFLHSPEYNLALSQTRAEKIKQYILSKNSSARILSCSGAGEKFSSDNGSPEGEAFQRRVDVVFERRTEPATKTPSGKTENKTSRDTSDKMVQSIEKMNKGEKLAIEGLNFEPGRHFITKASVPVLQQLLVTMKKNPDLKIQIQGHVCCTDGKDDGYDYDTHDRKLSENRARAIHDYLISKGIDRKRVSYKGFGHSQPKFPDEKTPEEEQANRRVEIMVIEK